MMLSSILLFDPLVKAVTRDRRRTFSNARRSLLRGPTWPRRVSLKESARRAGMAGYQV
jgi:hypothetical protein